MGVVSKHTADASVAADRPMSGIEPIVDEDIAAYVDLLRGRSEGNSLCDERGIRRCLPPRRHRREEMRGASSLAPHLEHVGDPLATASLPASIEATTTVLDVSSYI